MNSGKGSTVLLMFIQVATMLVAVAGATFAYFGATSQKDADVKIPTVESKSGAFLSINDFSSEIKGTNLKFDDVLVNKTFFVEGSVVGTSNYDYEINLDVKENTYKTGALVYTLTSENVSNNGTTIASTNKRISIPTGATTINLGKGLFTGPTTNSCTHKYTLRILYINNDNSTAPDLKASFKANLNITQPSEK